MWWSSVFKGTHEEAKLILCLLLPSMALAADTDKKVVIDGLSFDAMTDYLRSDYFRASGLRCGTPVEKRILLWVRS